MIRPLIPSLSPPLTVLTHTHAAVAAGLPAVERFLFDRGPAALSRHPKWLSVFKQALGHEVYAFEARAASFTCGFLPLAVVDSFLFGRYLVSLPYLNSNGVVSESPDVQSLLISRAVQLADELGGKHLELRHEKPLEHPRLNGSMASKVHMRLKLPRTTDAVWKGYDPKVRNQVRKAEKGGLTVTWGGADLLDPFYAVISHNMRDLGTPVYGRGLFACILATFPTQAEIAVVWSGSTPAAAALVLHGPGITEVPTASSLREFNTSCANMLLYRHLIDRAVERGQVVFDFGRSTADSPTFKFKKQWGAMSYPATWQYYSAGGGASGLRPENPRYQWLIRMWQRLPVPVTQFIGPAIVRGIP